MADEPFEMVVEEVWNLPSRPALIAIGSIRSGVVRPGERVVLEDDQGVASATVIGVEFHVRPPQTGLLLGDLEPRSLRAGQVMRTAAE